MAAAAIFKIGLMAISYIYTGIKNHTPQAILPSKFNFGKIQDGGGLHFEIHFNDHNSVTITH